VAEKTPNYLNYLLAGFLEPALFGALLPDFFWALGLVVFLALLTLLVVLALVVFLADLEAAGAAVVAPVVVWVAPVVAAVAAGAWVVDLLVVLLVVLLALEVDFPVFGLAILLWVVVFLVEAEREADLLAVLAPDFLVALFPLAATFLAVIFLLVLNLIAALLLFCSVD
jgi:hypothetical protein